MNKNAAIVFSSLRFKKVKGNIIFFKLPIRINPIEMTDGHKQFAIKVIKDSKIPVRSHTSHC